jgi:hypothetical protein
MYVQLNYFLLKVASTYIQFYTVEIIQNKFTLVMLLPLHKPHVLIMTIVYFRDAKAWKFVKRKAGKSTYILRSALMFFIPTI